MSTFETKRLFCGRPARVGDDVLLAAPKHGTTPKWRVVGESTGVDFGTFDAKGRLDALAALADELWSSGQCSSLSVAKERVAEGKYIVEPVAGAICLRAGKVLAISASRDVPWILDLGDIASGPSIDWVHAERELVPATFGDPKLFPLGSWTWVPPRGLLETLEIAEHALLAAGGWRPAPRGGHWLDTDGSTWPTNSALDLERMRRPSARSTGG